jgi:translation elongation factor EF-Ts
MDPKTIEQEAIVKLLGSTRSQKEWDDKVEEILTKHFDGRIPRFWIDLVIKSTLYLRTKEKWVYRKMYSSR